MNAQRRLEEFILKLSTAQNNHRHADLINELKLKVPMDNQKLNKKQGGNNLLNNSASFVDKYVGHKNSVK